LQQQSFYCSVTTGKEDTGTYLVLHAHDPLSVDADVRLLGHRQRLHRRAQIHTVEYVAKVFQQSSGRK
jgi:hypothetical protein